MKKIFSLTFSLICLSLIIKAQSVAINTDGATADGSSILDVKSTTKGMLVPRMTTAQRTTISTPATGLLVFDTDTKSFWFYNGSAWANISGGDSGSFTLPFNGSTSSSTSALSVLNTGAGAAIVGSGSGGAGVYGNSLNGAGVNALSTNGFGVVANSTNSSAIYGFNANATSAIKGVNSVGDGVRGQSSGNGVAGVSGISTAANGYGVWGNSNTGTGILAQSSNGIALEVNGNLKISGGNNVPSNGAVLTSNASGITSWKKAVAFKVKTIANTNIPEDQTLRGLFSTKLYDLTNSFDLPNATFTAPSKGLYHFDVVVSWWYALYSNATTHLVLERNGVTYNLDFSNSYFSWLYVFDHYETPIHNRISTDVMLEAGDKIYINVSQSNPDDNSARTIRGDECIFSGHLIYNL